VRLAFCVDAYRSHRAYQDQVGVEVRQDESGLVHGTVVGPGAGAAAAGKRAAGVAASGLGAAGLAAVRDQVARVLSLDHDGDAFRAAGRADPTLGRLQDAVPGLRPVLFCSPYEAAVWAILSARRARAQAAVLRARLCREYGRVFTLAGVDEVALPTPEQLLTVSALPGLPEARIPWLHGVAQAALDGQLDASTLAAADPDQAMASLQRLAGIGPFYAALIQIRATGATDVLTSNEPRVLALAGELYGLPGAMTQTDFAQRAEAWRPWRTWASVLIRAATRRLPPTPDRTP
jgi:DNA-3-methyladenine glycosylase II